MMTAWFLWGVPIAEAGGLCAARSHEGWGDLVEFLKKNSWVEKAVSLTGLC